MFENYLLREKTIEIGDSKVTLRKYNMADRSVILPVVTQILSMSQQVLQGQPQQVEDGKPVQYDMRQGKRDIAAWTDKVVYMIAHGLKDCTETQAREIVDTVESSIVEKLLVEIVSFNYIEADESKKKPST